MGAEGDGESSMTRWSMLCIEVDEKEVPVCVFVCLYR